MAATAVTLAVGTPALSFIGAVGAALTASIRRGGLILAVLAGLTLIAAVVGTVAAAALRWPE